MQDDFLHLILILAGVADKYFSAHSIRLVILVVFHFYSFINFPKVKVTKIRPLRSGVGLFLRPRTTRQHKLWCQILINALIPYSFLKVLSTIQSFFLKIPTRLLMDKHDRPNSSDIFWFVKRPVCHKKYIIRSLAAFVRPARHRISIQARCCA